MIPDISAPQGHSIVVIGWHVWGKGTTLKEAIKQARKVGKIQEGNYEAHIVPDDSGVNDMGQFEYHRNCQICQQIAHVDPNYKPKVRQL